LVASRLETERDGRVLVVRLENPPRNFMDRQMIAELTALMRSLARDRPVGSVVLTGKPDDLFVTHYDVAETLAGAEQAAIEMSAGDLCRRSKAGRPRGFEAIAARGSRRRAQWVHGCGVTPGDATCTRRYVEDLRRDGRGPWEDERTFAAWRDGTAVDLLAN
jgi:hypothetical protein